jgi:1,4-dihydroxy-2-naphthoate octaprenyltransferase
MRGRMTPGLAVVFMLLWVALGVAQLMEGRQDPVHNRHFWFGLLAVVFAIMYGYRAFKLAKAAKEAQGERQ